MEDHDYNRFDDFIHEGFHPHYDTRSYVCGWCGVAVSTRIGLFKNEERMGLLGDPFAGHSYRKTDIRICPRCWAATTFLDGKAQFPGPIKGDALDARKKNADAQTVVALYDEARIALSRGAASCAVLMFRKLLMHIAVEQGAKAGQRFVDYVNHLKDNGIVGKPQHALLERIRNDGNQENHDVVRANGQQAEELLSLVTLLVRSVYFSD